MFFAFDFYNLLFTLYSFRSFSLFISSLGCSSLLELNFCASHDFTLLNNFTSLKFFALFLFYSNQIF